MGFKMGNLFGRVRSQKEMQIVMVGLDHAAHNFKVAQAVTGVPTVGFNIESVKHNNINFTVMDVGGHEKIRPLWRHYFNNAHGLIFVVDGNDRERIVEAKDMLHNMLKEESLKDVAVLIVFANKKDSPNAMSVAEITERLHLHSLPRHHWHLQSSSATSGKGIYEGFDWFSSTVKALRH